jgi:hypothetical protein
MCQNSCQGNGNIQRLRSIFKDHKAILEEMQNEAGVDDSDVAGQGSAYQRGCLQMIQIMRNRVARTEKLISSAVESASLLANDPPSPIIAVLS